MARDTLVRSMLDDLARAAELRHRFSAGAAARARQDLRQWQAARLARTHADLLNDPRYTSAVAFFLTDLYGPDSNAARYEEAESVMPVAVRLLPHAGLETLADAWKLDAICESLDAAMIDALGRGNRPLTSARYAAAYQLVGREADRAAQIDLICDLARALERLAARRTTTVILSMMREPARIAGFSDLQGFLERGLHALRMMGPTARFIDTVVAQERRLMQALLAGDSALLDWSP
jgi:hypothetical protein